MEGLAWTPYSGLLRGRMVPLLNGREIAESVPEPVERRLELAQVGTAMGMGIVVLEATDKRELGVISGHLNRLRRKL